jgi:glycosyltransferase involved in cell wall biosynthesis
VPHIWHIREFGKLDFNFDFELGNYAKKIIKTACCLIANSMAVKKYYEEFLKDCNIVCIYNGVYIPEELNIKKRDDDKTIKMVLIGRISKEKGQKDAIEMCKHLINENFFFNFRLDIYGDGNDKEIINQMINDYGLQDKVFLMGYNDSIQIYKYDIGLMCSRNEAFGRVTVEYMAYGLPVVGTHLGGTGEIIEDSQTGYLYNSGNIIEFANAIMYLSKNEHERHRLGSNGRIRAKRYFSVDSYCHSVYNEYYKYFLEVPKDND